MKRRIVEVLEHSEFDQVAKADEVGMDIWERIEEECSMEVYVISETRFVCRIVRSERFDEEVFRFSCDDIETVLCYIEELFYA